MPELPEVETVKNGLSPVMTGQTISRAQINRPDLRWPFPDRMADRLTGQPILGLRRRSKYILADLGSGETLLIHLGMSGRILISGAPVGQFVHSHPAPAKHDHVVLDLESGARITFNDPRRFGAMDLLDTAAADSHPLLSKIGPEPLGNGFSESHLAALWSKRKTPVKSALLDQRTVAGLGNIYVCEALFRSGIHPTRRVCDVTKPEISLLVPTVRNVLQDAIRAGGSSLRDFRQADGELGYFQHQFDVYGREGQPCKTSSCRAEIERIVQSGRSTFFCAACQR